MIVSLPKKMFVFLYLNKYVYFFLKVAHLVEVVSKRFKRAKNQWFESC